MREKYPLYIRNIKCLIRFIFNLITCKYLIISCISIVLLFVLIAIVFRESSNVPNSFFFLVFHCLIICPINIITVIIIKREGNDWILFFILDLCTTSISKHYEYDELEWFYTFKKVRCVSSREGMTKYKISFWGMGGLL